MKKEIFAERQVWTNKIALFIGERQDSGNLHYMKKAEFEECLSDYSAVTPAMLLKIEEAQKLIDELWNCGLRPSEGSGSAGSLAATERHLKDMQSITRGLLKKDGVDI